MPFFCNRVVEESVDLIKKECVYLNYPVDGIVFKYDKIKEYLDAGRTDHHFKGRNRL